MKTYTNWEWRIVHFLCFVVTACALSLFMFELGRQVGEEQKCGVQR